MFVVTSEPLDGVYPASMLWLCQGRYNGYSVQDVSGSCVCLRAITSVLLCPVAGEHGFVMVDSLVVLLCRHETAGWVLEVD